MKINTEHLSSLQAVVHELISNVQSSNKLEIVALSNSSYYSCKHSSVLPQTDRKQSLGKTTLFEERV